MKLLFFDLETTGIKYWRNGVHQISGEIVIGLRRNLLISMSAHTPNVR